VQVDKIVYFALLLRKCVKTREPSSDRVIVRKFEEALSSFRNSHGIEEGYRQNKRSMQYVITMGKELEVIFRNNKLTSWGRTLRFFTPTDEIPIELPFEFKILFLRCFLLENYAMVKSVHDHLERFGEIRDDHRWYEKMKKMPKDELVNHAFSVYVQALKIAVESVHSLNKRRRYLDLYKNTVRQGKTAKALYPKIKPSLGMMEDLNLIDKREDSNNKISVSEKRAVKPYSEIIRLFPDYKTLVSRMQEDLLYIILGAFGYTGRRILSGQEMIKHVENLYSQLRDPAFNVCDINTLISITVIQKSLEGYRLKESEVRETITEEQANSRHKYRILPDRYGEKRFLRIKG
jgi:hypothetical protein